MGNIIPHQEYCSFIKKKKCVVDSPPLYFVVGICSHVVIFCINGQQEMSNYFFFIRATFTLNLMVITLSS
jgi:hypothetical protein